MARLFGLAALIGATAGLAQGVAYLLTFGWPR